MSKVEETYLYSVMNRRPIKLDCGVEIRSPKSLYLTKNDVLKCLNTAYVYRRFANGQQERVTIANVDRLHNAKFIPENEWDVNGVKIEEVVPEPEVVVEPVAEEEKIDIEVDDTVDNEPEEVAELTSAIVVEEQEESTDDTTENISVVDEDDVVEDEAEQLVEDDVTINEDEQISGQDAVEVVEDNETGVSESSESKTQNNANYTYNGKKKHHNRK